MKVVLICSEFAIDKRGSNFIISLVAAAWHIAYAFAHPLVACKTHNDIILHDESKPLTPNIRSGTS